MSGHPCNESPSGSRQAVVLIHGIGEQHPMKTLRSFVEAVWKNNPKVEKHDESREDVWSKPDLISGNFELRRLTTDYNKNCTRTDFFEYYWAHLMEGTEFSHVLSWVKRMLLRPPWRLPKRLLSTYLVLWIVILIIFAALVLGWLFQEIAIPGVVITAVGVVAPFLYNGLINPVIGDAARYLSPSPHNIKVRQAIRDAGIDLLTQLHNKKDDGQPTYDRIIVVGHSLGTVIGYDVLKHLWHKYHQQYEINSTPSNTVLEKMEDLTRKIDELINLKFSKVDFTKYIRHKTVDEISGLSKLVDEYREKQRDYLSDLQNSGNCWRVSDFITLGSPLTYADLLLADNPKDLRERQQMRELPTCPPTLEEPGGESGSRRFSYQAPTNSNDPHQESKRIPHFAASFAPVCWTNLYFKPRMILWGDIIGGPLGWEFGYGIKDVELETSKGIRFMSHIKYWKMTDNNETPEHIASLCEALLLDYL